MISASVFDSKVSLSRTRLNFFLMMSWLRLNSSRCFSDSLKASVGSVRYSGLGSRAARAAGDEATRAAVERMAAKESRRETVACSDVDVVKVGEGAVVKAEDDATRETKRVAWIFMMG